MGYSKFYSWFGKVVEESVFKKLEYFTRWVSDGLLKKLYERRKRYPVYVSFSGFFIGGVSAYFLEMKAAPFTIMCAGGVAAALSWISIELNKESRNKDTGEKVFDDFNESFWKTVREHKKLSGKLADEGEDVREAHSEHEKYVEFVKGKKNEMARLLNISECIKHDGLEDFGFSSCKEMLKGELRERGEELKAYVEKKDYNTRISEINDLFRRRISLIHDWSFYSSSAEECEFYYKSAIGYHVFPEKSMKNFHDGHKEMQGFISEYHDYALGEVDDRVDPQRTEDAQRKCVNAVLEMRAHVYSKLEKSSVYFSRRVRLSFIFVAFVVSLAFGYNVFYAEEEKSFLLGVELKKSAAEEK